MYKVKLVDLPFISRRYFVYHRVSRWRWWRLLLTFATLSEAEHYIATRPVYKKPQTVWYYYPD